MNQAKLTGTSCKLLHHATLLMMICGLWGVTLPASSAPAKAKPASEVQQAAALRKPEPPCAEPVVMGDDVFITMGKVKILPLKDKARRIIVGGLPSGYAGKPEDDEEQGQGQKSAGQTAVPSGVANADIVLLGPKELYLLGKAAGSMNVVIQNQNNQCTVMGVTVMMDAASLQNRLHELIPGSSDVKVSSVRNSYILSGTVSDAVKVDQTVTLAHAYAGIPMRTGSAAGAASTTRGTIINMLKVSAPQQVMLEVKMAEVSKNILDKLGAEFTSSGSEGGIAHFIASGFLSLTGSATKGVISITDGDTTFTFDAENKDGLIKILAEPNIMAISGQEGSFLAGGTIFIPVSQSIAVAGGVPTVSLEEKEFGVGLKFTPTVLEDGLINLRVAPEVSELSQTGVAITSGANSSILPSFVVRRAATTVQLRDGQSFAIAGLIKNNVNETIRRFPILGEIPILGALFRSSEFQSDKTELLFVITPRLVKPLPANYRLPTDTFIEPSRTEFMLGGKLEGNPTEPVAPTPDSAAPPADAVKPESADPSGFEMK